MLVTNKYIRIFISCRLLCFSSVSLHCVEVSQTTVVPLFFEILSFCRFVSPLIVVDSFFFEAEVFYLEPYDANKFTCAFNAF